MNKVIKGDLFAQPGIPVIPTNMGGVHGAGVAKIAMQKGLIRRGEGPFGFRRNKAVTFPVKYVWYDTCDIDLMQHSAFQLMELTRNHPDLTFYIPLVGIGHGEGNPVEITNQVLLPILEGTDNVVLVLPTPEIIAASPKGKARTDDTSRKLPVIEAILRERLNHEQQH
jgi:hypothetical protein